MGLSVNASIFGSDNQASSSSIWFFATGSTNTPPDYKSLFDAVRNELGFDKTWEDFETLFDEYQRNNGRLYQIFIRPDKVDEIGYLAKGGGSPFLIPIDNVGETDAPSATLSLLRKDPTAFNQKIASKLQSVQTRLFLKPEFFNDPNLVQIRVYDNKPENPQQDQGFWAKLNAMVDDDVAQWTLKKEKLSDGALYGGEQPTERLAKEIYKGEAGLPYEQKDPIQRKMLKLKQLLDTGDVQGVQDFIKANPTYPLDMLIEHVDYYKPQNSFKLPPLFYVYDKVPTNKQDLIKSLIQGGANINTTDDFKETLFTRVIRDKNQDLIDMLLTQDSLDINYVDRSGRTYLHEAVQTGNPDFMKALIEKGADVNAKNEHGDTPLHIAMMRTEINRDIVNL